MKQGWEIKNIGSIADITDYVANGSFATLRENVSYLNEEGYAILVRLADYTNGFDSSKFVYIDEHAYNFLAKSKLYGGEIIMSNVGSIGKCFKCPDLNKPMSLAPNSIVIRTPNNDFYHYVFQSLYFQSEVKRISSQTALPKFNKTSFKNINVPIPPREEQERIAEELDCLSGVIERKREQLKQLDALAQSIFYQMFGDPITNEKGWKVKKLEELCDIINGFAFPSSDFAECNPIKAIKITNVGVNEFISDDSSLPEEYNNMEGCKVHTGDIVIALTRTIISTGVKRAIVPNEYNESLVNQRVAAILANDRIVSRRFLYSFLGTDFVRQYILQKATALMQPNLSIRDLRDMPTIYPPLTLQQEFADKIEAIEKQKELIKQSITQTEELFNSRMDYYFN